MSYYYADSNYSFNNIFKGIETPTYDAIKHVHKAAVNQQNAMQPMVQLNHRIINPPNEDMSRAYSAVDMQGLNTSTQKIPDSLVLDKNPITFVPQRPFYVQT